jgi:hypothetical protein
MPPHAKTCDLPVSFQSHKQLWRGSTPFGRCSAGCHVLQEVRKHAALTTAYNDAAGRPSTTVGTKLGGQTLAAGIYSSPSGTFSMTGTLVLDGQNNPDAVFIFQTASTLITAAAANITLISGAQAATSSGRSAAPRHSGQPPPSGARSSPTPASPSVTA